MPENLGPKPFSRFFLSDEIWSDEAIKVTKARAASRLKPKDKMKNEAFQHFMSWERSPNEIALFTLRAHNSFRLPQTYHCIFAMDEPETVVFAECKLTQVLYEGWLPSDRIDSGHKHLCIFEFPAGIPDLLNCLPVYHGRELNHQTGVKLIGICKQEHFEVIGNRINYIKHLKSKYGSKWHEFDQENVEKT